MPEGGRLTIATSADRLPDASRPEPCALLAVSDTGVGMSPETLSHIFEPFFTTKEPGKGTGLGLATVFGIVQQHRGQIRVTSVPGQGASFRIYLPLAGSAEAPAAGTEHSPRALEGTERVLVVEDDERVRALVSGVLRSHGYAVQVAESPAAALALLAGEGGGGAGAGAGQGAAEPGAEAGAAGAGDAGAGPRLLITDVVMPGTGGRELYAALRQRFPGLRVLYMSGYADVLVRRQAGELDLLQKPFSLRDLLERVRAALDS
jgi:CheY-like chemotaxis protein